MRLNCSVRGIGVAVSVSVSTVAQRLQLVLYVHAELLFLIDDQQAEILVHHVLAHQPVRADKELSDGVNSAQLPCAIA